MRQMWTYSDGAGTVKGYCRPGGAAGAGSWVLVDQASGTVQGIVRAGEFSRRFRPVDVFADVPALPGYLGTVTAADGTALVDLVLDRNPFILANGPRRAARRSSGAHSPVPQPRRGPQPSDHLDLRIRVDRAGQRRAALMHASQT